jgi:ATP-binding cassette subfamily B protein/subfamily B ATP-binding cassette protein MsbA
VKDTTQDTPSDPSRSSRSAFDNYHNKHGSEEPPSTPSSPDHDSKTPPPQRGALKLIRSFWRLCADQHASILLALFGLTLATIIGLAPPVAVKVVFDNVLGSQPLPDAIIQAFPFLRDRQVLLATVLGATLALSIMTLILRFAARWLAYRAGMKTGVHVRRRVFEQTLRLPLHRVQTIQSGGAVSLLRDDAGAPGSLVLGLLYEPWQALVELVGILLVLALVEPTMLIGGLILVPMVALSHRTWIGRIRPMWKAARRTRRQTDAQATQSFGGIRIVRTYGRERTEGGRFVRGHHLKLRQEVQAWWWSRSIHAIWGILVPLATAALLWYGGNRILSDRELLAQGAITASEALTIGKLVMFLTYILRLLGPLSQLATSATAVQSSLAGLDRVLDLLEELDEEGEQPGDLLPPPTRPRSALSIDNLTFSYPDSERPVLQNITIEIEPGETIALVGPSGAGKTTLCDLVARFQKPQSGRILMDGVDISRYPIGAYRALLSVVEQEVFLFDGSIADNISYGRHNATREEVISIAQKSGIDTFIQKLENGYDTLVGERGVRLSGGQKQQIALARALLADPSLLILDEATSHLDAETEARIRQNLNLLLSNRTCIVIAHRFSTIAIADRIAYLSEGRIVDLGPHQELFERNEAYRRMVILQTESHHLERPDSQTNKPDDSSD